MKSHPGGAAHTRRMLELAGLPDGTRILDMGAGTGKTLAILHDCGFKALGIDIEPRGWGVERGDLLNTDFPDESFDAVLSECSFFVTGNQRGALFEAKRVLKSGGMLLLSDVFFEKPEDLLAATGFLIEYAEDMTALWREYFLEALWREEGICCEIPRGKCEYWMIIGRKV